MRTSNLARPFRSKIIIVVIGALCAFAAANGPVSACDGSESGVYLQGHTRTRDIVAKVNEGCSFAYDQHDNAGLRSVHISDMRASDGLYVQSEQVSANKIKIMFGAQQPGHYILSLLINANVASGEVISQWHQYKIDVAE